MVDVIIRRDGVPIFIIKVDNEQIDFFHEAEYATKTERQEDGVLKEVKLTKTDGPVKISFTGAVIDMRVIP